MVKKVLLLCAIFAATTGTTYFLLRPNTKKQTDKALSLLRQDNFKAAEAALKTSASLSLGQKFLLKAYVEQARGRYTASERLLHTAHLESKKNQQSGLIQEILLARAANAFFEKRENDFDGYLEAAQKISTDELAGALTFFEALHCYVHQNYAEALRLWDCNVLLETNVWMTLALDKLFPPHWKKIHTAHCLLEKNDILQGREILEKECHDPSCGQEYQQLATLFLGLSYLKEAHKIPFDQRSSYYTMARFYFERSQVGGQFGQEKSHVVQQLEEEAKTLLRVEQDNSQWALECVHILQAWNEKEALTRIAEELAENLALHGEVSSICFCQEVRKQFQGTIFHNHLTEKILAFLELALKRGESDELARLWGMVEALAPNPKTAAKEIASLTSEEIFETVKKDTMQLARTRTYLTFWEKLERNPGERERLAHDLFYQSKLFWHNEKQEKKGLRLMEIALDLSNDPASLKKEVAAFLTTLYMQAENSNMIRRQTLIYEAMEHFDVSRQELVTKATLANHLADSEYLYEVRNYPSAKMHANWVLKLDPENDNARRLVGLCSFHLGEYNKALIYLKGLRDPDEDARKALMLTQIFSSQERGKQLCQSDTTEAFEDSDSR
jgi:hypothetical protein